MLKILQQMRSAIAVLHRRHRLEGEMEEELRSHIDHRAEDLQRSGLARSEAERQARVEFGGYERFKEACRESLGAHFLETLMQDLGFGLRLLRKAPGFAAVAVLTLALGIGANTAIFSVVYGVLLRPLPYTHPDQLVIAFQDNLQRGVKISGCSYPDLQELQNSGVFAGVAGVNRHDLTLTGAGDPTVVTTVVVTPEIFPLLNVKPLAGRYLVTEDEIKGAAPVVVLSEGLWRTRYGGSLGMIGGTITLDQRPFTVVGIMPAGFRVPVFSQHQEIWIPLVQDPLFSAWIPKRDEHWLPTVARLNPGVSLTRARAEADSIARRMSQEFPTENSGWAVRLQPLQEAIVGNVKAPLLVLLCAVGLVLLLACVNIANLLLARATSRTREMALRQALGAKRSRIIRQLLTESVLLGALGAILGVALAYASSAGLASLLPRNGLAVANTKLDGWVLGFALLLSLAATMAFSLAPAFLATHANVQSNLKDSAARSGSSGARLRVRRFLAAAEIGLAAVLVVAAGLLVRSLMTMTAVDPGFNVAHILKMEVSLPRYRYSTHRQWTAFGNTLLERIQAQPGFKDSAIGLPTPLADNGASFNFSMPDHAPLPPGTPTAADWVSVSPEYFQVMGIPLLRGRVFGREDADGAPPVTIVNEAFARFYFRNEDPIGRRLTFGFPPDTNVIHQIVGVVGNVRDRRLAEEPVPMMYVPFAQEPLWGGELLIKSSLPPAAVVSTIRAVVSSLDKDLPVTGITTMPEVIDASVAQPKFRAWLLGAFGIVAVLLAAVGVFGVVSYSVASRTQEFGVRAALGASPASIGSMILKQGLLLGGIGLSLGLAAALGFARLVRSELYDVSAYDPTTLFVSIVVLLAVAVAACYIPARRAMTVDPIIALRCE